MSYPIAILLGMGYRGKLHEQDQARRLRAQGWTMPDIAKQLGVSQGSVSAWTRDVAYQPRLWRRMPARHGRRRRTLAEIEACLAKGSRR
ncbi:MAG: hypothetical protein QOG03_2567, partial [Actinomycetota bacterium]|nr:hypothetical protein [Actinomycetota bacterium]